MLYISLIEHHTVHFCGHCFSSLSIFNLPDPYFSRNSLYVFRNAMTVEQMYEDFSADHANKTITMETHPHLPGPPLVLMCSLADSRKKLTHFSLVDDGKLET
jgi:hypothetical protein